VRAEHVAVREAVGVMDMSLMSKFSVEDRTRWRCSIGSTSDIDVAPGTVVYTQWCDVDGGILADLTVTPDHRPLPRHRQRREPPPRPKLLRTALEPGEVAVTTDITSGTTLLSVRPALA
jgi:4-methylaminobutanoate oxidase (formaldehyde-forming)